MLLIHVLVVSAVLQWSVVTGEGRTEQLTMSLCRLWEECARTAVTDDLTHAELGTPDAICVDFVDMLEKHGVSCEVLQDPEEEAANVEQILASIDSHRTDEEQKQESPPTNTDEKETASEIADHKEHLAGGANSLVSSTNLWRNGYFDDCSEIYAAQALFSNVVSGVFPIRPANDQSLSSVYCDQTTDGGGWTVIQRRLEGSLEFFRMIDAYRYGFGDPSGEYWLGLDNIHRITAQNSYELYVELEDWDGNVGYAKYSTFSVGAGDDYTLSIGGYSGTAGDGFGTDQSTSSYNHLNGAKFSTRWYDQDTWSSGSLAEQDGGGWWYKDVPPSSNLNGPYFRDTDGHISWNGHGVRWSPSYGWGWYYSLRKTKMMIRPTDFSTRVANIKLEKGNI